MSRAGDDGGVGKRRRIPDRWRTYAWVALIILGLAAVIASRIQRLN